MTTNPSFKNTKALSFDIYGTLIDWEGGIIPTLHPLTRQLPSNHECHPTSSTYQDSAIKAFQEHEQRIIAANPTALYQDLLARAYMSVGEEWGVAAKQEDAAHVAANIPNWVAFRDTVDAMQRLGKQYKLIALSNISNELFAKTATGPLKDVKFDAVYTAEDIGSYKPDLKNFEYLLRKLGEDFGLTKDQLVHVAHGARPDQEPAEKMGIGHVWIRRDQDNWDGVERAGDQKWWETLGDMADEVCK